MIENGTLVISLDFELIWGVFDVMDYEKRIDYFENTRSIIPEILELFQKHNIECTWATVGMLFNQDWEEWEKNNPDKEPEYRNKTLSPYIFGREKRGANFKELFFAPDLISKICRVPGQEIGSHTYSHYYCIEAGQTLVEFRADLESALRIAKEFSIEIKSLVFPRNQINKEYLKICSDLGITSVRSNPNKWYWKDPTSDRFSTKLFRTGDAYTPFFSSTSYDLSVMKKQVDMPLEQPASRFLRPFESSPLLHKMKMTKIFQEMTYAAKHGEIYHLWWHPHNFGESPQESLKDLSGILDHFLKLQKKYGFRSLNMNGIYKAFSK